MTVSVSVESRAELKLHTNGIPPPPPPPPPPAVSTVRTHSADAPMCAAFRAGAEWEWAGVCWSWQESAEVGWSQWEWT